MAPISGFLDCISVSDEVNIDRHILNQMKSQAFRIASYTKWPKWANARPVQLADAGLYYTGMYDEVKCFACKAKFKQWSEVNDPMSEHMKASPNCPFVQEELQSGNIPLVTDVADIQEIDGFREEAAQIEDQADVPNNDVDGLPIDASGEYPKYALESKRLGTFTNWPTSHHIKPVDLAEAGFFYQGYSDNVRCFFCGMGLGNWEKGDTPWEEHARWFYKCGYLKQVKGDDWIKAIRKKYDEKIIFEGSIAQAQCVSSSKRDQNTKLPESLTKSLTYYGLNETPTKLTFQSHSENVMLPPRCVCQNQARVESNLPINQGPEHDADWEDISKGGKEVRDEQ
ncbi:unnamed protein product [Owenia fusiformis]|uniref:Uncharacterized protein n=1 Tax=Owenia fusiformis TaxID=6347 RepID=A0A8J1XJ36_OWEFU|nr:unnamed protein product [Owenia fusiformis]